MINDIINEAGLAIAIAILVMVYSVFAKPVKDTTFDEIDRARRDGVKGN